MTKRLYRSNRDVKLAGVLAGIAEYFRMDPTILRLIFAVAWMFSAGTLSLVYLAAAIIIPKSEVY